MNKLDAWNFKPAVGSDALTVNSLGVHFSR